MCKYVLHYEETTAFPCNQRTNWMKSGWFYNCDEPLCMYVVCTTVQVYLSLVPHWVVSFRLFDILYYIRHSLNFPFIVRCIRQCIWLFFFFFFVNHFTDIRAVRIHLFLFDFEIEQMLITMHRHIIYDVRVLCQSAGDMNVVLHKR